MTSILKSVPSADVASAPGERLASAWQGLLDGDSPERDLAPADWDLLLGALLGRATASRT